MQCIGDIRRTNRSAPVRCKFSLERREKFQELFLGTSMAPLTDSRVHTCSDDYAALHDEQLLLGPVRAEQVLVVVKQLPDGRRDL